MNPAVDISQVILETPRLILRPWKLSDLSDFYRYASSPKVGPMAGWKPHESEEDSRAILERFIEGQKTFAIVHRETGRVIGSIGIEAYDEESFAELAESKCRELGFVLAEEYWGQGLMPEAGEAVVAYLFSDFGLDLILCGHFARNKQSARVQEKLGFKPYRIVEQRLRSSGNREEVHSTILRREDYLASKLC
jgi:ribosomal-protein-alanine N-acetyltransferase